MGGVRQIRLQPGVATAFILLVIPLIGALVGYAYRTNADLALSQATRDMDRVTGDIVEEVQNLLSPVARVVDGQMNPIETTHYGRLHTAQNYMTLTNHLYAPFLWTANRDFMAGLSEAQRQIVADAVAEGVRASRARTGAYSDSRLAMLFPSVRIHHPTEDELAAFRAATQAPMREFVAATFGEEGRLLLADFLAAIAQAQP